MEVKILQSDMPHEMQKIIPEFIVQGFKRKVEYEDISKYIKDECDKKFGEQSLWTVT